MLIFFIFCKKCKKSKKGIDNFHYRKYNYLVMQLGISKSISKRKKESALIMRKQTKLVAVLSTAALLALGASMSSFAATGWQEENGTWVYYDKNGDTATETWAKSGDNWFYLNDDGEMATDVVVEYKDNYYYVDENGAMVANKWVSVENEDYDGEDEPINYWYYFGANGKAFTGSNDKPSFKTVNGKKYTFDEEGRMQYGWIGEDGKRNSADDAWKEAKYFCGDENDGAQSIGWKLIDITDTDVDGSDLAPITSSKNVFDDEDQSRWFWFKANGKKENTTDGTSINGAKYSFDQYGRMNAEWVTKKDATPGTATTSEWRYFRSVDDGARVTKGWFKVVPDDRLNHDDYEDDSDSWFYADGKGSIYANKIKEINGKRYAFNDLGQMKSGLRLIKLGATSSEIDSIKGSDVKGREIDTKDDFLKNINDWLEEGYSVYNFGDGDDGSMKTGKQSITLDGEKFTFNFGKSGVSRGAGKNGIESSKIYQGGMLLTAEKDDKYAVVKVTTDADGEKTFDLLTSEDFLNHYCDDAAKLEKDEDRAWTPKTIAGVEFKLINTSGSIQSGKSSAKDGEDNIFRQTKEDIVRIYVKK
jgi:glucan-binding YG repeat protein